MHDFGDVSQQESLEATFRLTNTLDQPVEIFAVLKSCSCAEAEPESKLIGVGESTALRIRWETGSRRGPAAENVTLLYGTSRDTSASLTVQVRANVVPVFDLQPAEVTFDPTTPGEARIVCRPRTEDGGRVTKATTDHVQVRAEVAEEDEAVVVRFAPDPDLPAGTLPATVYISTTNPKEPTIRVPIRFRN